MTPVYPFKKAPHIYATLKRSEPDMVNLLLPWARPLDPLLCQVYMFCVNEDTPRSPLTQAGYRIIYIYVISKVQADNPAIGHSWIKIFLLVVISGVSMSCLL